MKGKDNKVTDTKYLYVSKAPKVPLYNVIKPVKIKKKKWDTVSKL
jgi:hypothetical protein